MHSITWYDMVKWCNARRLKEVLTPCYSVSGSTYKTGNSAPDCNFSANGYRLPTAATTSGSAPLAVQSPRNGKERNGVAKGGTTAGNEVERQSNFEF